nr:GPI-anchored protein like [Ipomoea batatas]
MDDRDTDDRESNQPLVQQGSNWDLSNFIGGNDASITNDNLLPQLFTSVPKLNEAASFLAEKTSLFTSCLPDLSGPAFGHSGEQEMVTFESRDSGGSVSCSYTYSGATTFPSESSHEAADVPSVHEGIPRSSAQSESGSFLNSSAIVSSTQSNRNGISIFQGLIERVQRTVRGSADDIGWMQRDPQMPPVEDGTDRFLEILDAIRHGVHRLPNSVVYLLVPGLFSNHGPLYFVNTKTSFSKMGLTCHIAKIHSEASVEKNASEIKDYIEEIFWGSGKRVLLLGHSKGGIDAAAALSIYWTDLKDKVSGLALTQSPYGGTPIASDILREGQLGDYVNIRKLMEIIICKVIKGDMQSLEDLTYEKRKAFLRKYQLPRELPIISFHTEASISPAVLASLSRVAHAELPTFSAGQSTTLPVVMPLGAAMAACAQLLQIRYGEKSDGLVTCRDAEVPGSVVVRPKRKLDHAWMVYSSLNDDPSEADASQVCEALLTLLVEVGLRKRQELAKKDE